MAFPASTLTTQDAWDEMRKLAIRAKSAAGVLSVDSLAGDTNRDRYVRLQRILDQIIDRWLILQAVPGLEAYARDQINDPVLNLQAEYIAMRDAGIALRSWIFSNIPIDSGSGAALLYSVDADGNQISLTFSTAQTTTFRTNVTTFVATIS